MFLYSNFHSVIFLLMSGGVSGPGHLFDMLVRMLVRHILFGYVRMELLCLTITSIRKPWLPWRLKAQISLQEIKLACFLQELHLKIHHNIMLRPCSPWTALSQRPSLAKVQSRTVPTRCRMGNLCHAAENFWVAWQSKVSPNYPSFHRSQIFVMFERFSILLFPLFFIFHR